MFVLAAFLAFSTNGGDDEPAAVVAVDAPSNDQPDPVDDEPAPAGSELEEADNEPTDLEPDPAEETAAEPAVDAPLPEPELTGFIIPIDGACLSEFEGHFPSSPRAYRNGIHEGFDFYGFASCRSIDSGTAVLAAKDGVVIRVDHGYTELTIAQFEEATDPSVATLNPELRAQYLDRLRGRQVWVDHGAGVVTRYAHLSAVAAGLQVGDQVRAGLPIAFVGESGQLEAITAPGTDWHLHFEIRVGESYLGEGLLPALARSLYLESFGFEAGLSGG